MKKILALTTLILAGLTGSAHATTVDILLGPPGSGTGIVTPSLVSGAFAPITLVSLHPAFSTAGPVSLSGGVLTVGAVGLAVYNITGVGSLVPAPNEFEFRWLNPSAGTVIDVSTTDTNGSVIGSYSILGAQIVAAAGGTSNPIDVIIADPNAVLVSAGFDSTFGNGATTGFMVSDFAEAELPTPLPGSVGLFLTGLVGLFAFGRRFAFKR
jgi:hypothetical protein